MGLAPESRRRVKSGPANAKILLPLAHCDTQIAWFSIGLASWRFRKAWQQQGRSLDDLKFRATWTWPWGPPFVVGTFPSFFSISRLTFEIRYSVWRS